MLKWRYMGTINQVGVWVIKKAMLRIGSGYWLLQLELCANEIQLLIQDRTRNTQIAAQLLSCVWELISSLKVVYIKKSYKSFYIYSFSHFVIRVCASPSPDLTRWKNILFWTAPLSAHVSCMDFWDIWKYTFHSSWLEHIKNWAELNEHFHVYRVCCMRARLT